MSKIYIGAKLRLSPFPPLFDHTADGVTPITYPCTVIGINRKHSYFRVRFDFKYGSFTESYKFDEVGELP